MILVPLALNKKTRYDRHATNREKNDQYTFNF